MITSKLKILGLFSKHSIILNLCLSFFIVVLLTLANCRSVKLSARIQDASTIAKTFALVVIIITGIVRLAQGQLYGIHNSKVNGWKYYSCNICVCQNITDSAASEPVGY